MFWFVGLSPAPCIPQNLQTSSDCKSDVLLSKWDLAEGALRYTVEAFGNKGNNSHYNCSSLSNSCAMEGIHCGEYLTIYITAFDDECASPRTLGPVAQTGEEKLLVSVYQIPALGGKGIQSPGKCLFTQCLHGVFF